MSSLYMKSPMEITNYGLAGFLPYKLTIEPYRSALISYRIRGVNALTVGRYFIISTCYVFGEGI